MTQELWLKLWHKSQWLKCFFFVLQEHDFQSKKWEPKTPNSSPSLVRLFHLPNQHNHKCKCFRLVFPAGRLGLLQEVWWNVHKSERNVVDILHVRSLSRWLWHLTGVRFSWRSLQGGGPGLGGRPRALLWMCLPTMGWAGLMTINFHES